MNIQTIEHDEILLVGYKKNTRFGFFVIDQCWRKLHAKKSTISHRINTDFLIGLNDYSTWDITADRQPAFDYYAASEVSQFSESPKGMDIKNFLLQNTSFLPFRLKVKTVCSL